MNLSVTPIKKAILPLTAAAVLAGGAACNRNNEDEQTIFAQMIQELSEYRECKGDPGYTRNEVTSLVENGRPVNDDIIPQIIDTTELNIIKNESNLNTILAYRNFKDKETKTREDSLNMYNIIDKNEKTMSAIEFLKVQRAVLDAERLAAQRIQDSLNQAQEERQQALMKSKIEQFDESVKSGEFVKKCME